MDLWQWAELEGELGSWSSWSSGRVVLSARGPRALGLRCCRVPVVLSAQWVLIDVGSTVGWALGVGSGPPGPLTGVQRTAEVDAGVSSPCVWRLAPLRWCKMDG